MKTIHKITFVVAVLVSTVLSAQTPTENYVKTTTYQTPVQEGGQAQVLEDDKIIAVNYFDGLGRAKQSVAVRAGGQGQSTNILDWTDDWTVGQGSTPLFNRNGSPEENQRIFGENPFGEQSLLWECINDAANDGDGGWNTDHIAVDKNVSYRYAVWVKRTGSQDGKTYHGTTTVNNLSGSANSNPYFWSGDLPQLDTWYLMIGVVHPHTYTGGNSGISGVYDINGNKVINGTDFKWRPNTTTAYFRSYLYYATDINVRQYFWNPVLTQLDDNQQPIAQLIQQSKPKDIVTHYEYDGLGRQAKSYLPYASEQTKNGAIYTNPLAELSAFYNTTKYENTTNPYSETVFEKSPLNRPLKQAAPGLDWKAKTTGDDHTIKLDTRANNSTDAVVYFKVNFPLLNGKPNTEAPTLVKDGYYDPNQLYVSITKDENWKTTDGDNHTTKEYKDKLGRVVLKRTYADVDTDNNGTIETQVPHDTHYVYDKFGNLTYVIPPKVDISNGVDTTELNELCYQYIYDYRNRLVENKIPGKGWEYIVYNILDLPVVTQDAIQRSKNPKEWLVTKYDALGRVAFTALHKSNVTRQQAASNGHNTSVYEQYVKRITSPILVAGTEVYYTNKTLPHGISEVHTINYYDDYSFNHTISNPGTVYGQKVTTNAKGLPTGTKVNVLGTSYWITTVTYYDEKGRPIYVHSKNDYLGTTDIVETKLDFTGKPEETKTTHIKGSNAPIVTIDKFDYDHMGRLLTQKQKINNQTEELIAHNVYDELGQLESKKVGNAEQAPLQTVDYTYNIRGWLKGINDVNTLGNDLFSFKINYNTTDIEQSKALYNGNISETHWKTANDNKHQNYKYSYDALNRLKSALQGFDNFSTSLNYVGQIDYDKNGNIKNLLRFDQRGYSNPMDNLIYAYDNDNKLLGVTDDGDKTEGFIDGNTTEIDFVYDQNGNMTIDRNKGITGISYNHLNLPTNVVVANSTDNGNIQYIYDATGAKLKKIVTEGSSLTTTEYARNYIYKNGQLQFFNTAEGYVEPDGNSWKYIYQYKDHLGNIRLSYADSNNDGSIDVVRNATDVDGDGDNAMEILEEKNYYPFGMTHKGYNDTQRGTPHNYGLGSKEENDELGLNWLDFGWRNYDPAIARWMNIDPMTDKREWLTPYQYVQNSPMLRIDPDGAFDIFYINNDGSIEQIQQEGAHEFYVQTSTGDQGAFAEDYTLAGTLTENADGLVQFPDSGSNFGRYGTNDAGGTSTNPAEEVGEGDRYITPETAAALFGLVSSLEVDGLSIDLGDMSSSNGSDPWQAGFIHHSGHGHLENRSGIDVDFRYLNKSGNSFQDSNAFTSTTFSTENNQNVYDTATNFGFTVNYQGTSGNLTGPTSISGHNDHGHIGRANNNSNVTTINSTKPSRPVPVSSGLQGFNF